MKKLIINIKAGQQQLIDMTSKEIADRQAEIDQAIQDEQNRKVEENQRRAALQRLKTAALSDTTLADLLKYLRVN